MPYNYIITFKINRDLLEHLDKLVKQGYYNSRSEAIREAIKQLIIIHNNFREQLRRAWGEGDAEEEE